MTAMLSILLIVAADGAQAQTTIDDTDPSIIYSSIGGGAGAWTHGTGDPADFGGDEHFTNYDQNPQSSVILGPIAVENFSGTGITLLGKKGPNFGIGAWSIDGGPWSTVDAYNATVLHQQPLVSLSGLSSGPHVLAYQLTNAKNPRSSDIYQVIDAYQIAGTPLPLSAASVGNFANGQAKFAGSGWTFGGSSPTNLGGIHGWDGTAGDSVSWTFTGNLIEVFGRPDTGDGLFDVYIDGARVAQNIDEHYGTIDNDALTAYLIWAGTLPSMGPHTIKIVVDGVEGSHGGAENSGLKNLIQFDEFAAWSVTATTPPPPPPSTGSLTGTLSAAAGSYDLAALGTLDWAEWGGEGSYANFDHKASGGGAISTASQVGSGGNYGWWSDASRTTTWTGGAPTASSSGNHGYIWSNGAVGSGFSFTVPADTTSRMLSVYGGASNASARLTAHLSDGSAADISESFTGPGAFVTSFTYHAGTAGQTLTVTLIKSGDNAGHTDGSADLKAAWLSLTTSAAPPTGGLAGTMSPAASSYDLAALGTIDWSEWGGEGSYANFDHKASGGSEISTVAQTGSGGNYGWWSDATRTTNWTGGAPTASSSGNHGYIWSNGALGSGFSFTVPADTTSRVLSVYGGASNASARLTAHLSDGSAADISESFTGPGAFVTSFTYHAAAAGQTLTVTLIKSGNNSGHTDGSADLKAAWLASDPAVAPAMPIGISWVPLRSAVPGFSTVDATLTYSDIRSIAHGFRTIYARPRPCVMGD